MTDSGNGQPVEILLVEDNPSDVRLTVDVLEEGRLPNKVSVVGDGVDLERFIRVAHSIEDFWFPIVSLPVGQRGLAMSQ